MVHFCFTFMTFEPFLYKAENKLMASEHKGKFFVKMSYSRAAYTLSEERASMTSSQKLGLLTGGTGARFIRGKTEGGFNKTFSGSLSASSWIEGRLDELSSFVMGMNSI